MQRKVQSKVKGFRTTDGAGVSLVRVLGNTTTKEFDPFLMLDSFDSTEPSDYTAGFPLHPHRGIETISYVSKGKMMHKDSLGNSDTIGDGEVQWMNSGSGIMHEEQIPAADRMLGVQLWLNLPKKDKMSVPTYKSIKNSEIKEVPVNGGFVRVLAGEFEGVGGHKGEFLPFDYYDIHIKAGSQITLKTQPERSVMVFTLLGEAEIESEKIGEKTAAKLTSGDSVTINAITDLQLLFMSSLALNEPIAWAGPIVMNSRAEILEAFDELDNGNFIKHEMKYE